MLYRSLKILIGIAIRAYFRRIKYRNIEKVPKAAPLLFCANHPSAFMDPLVVAAAVKARLHFLVRGESFRNPVAKWFYGHLNMIPVYRTDETPDEMHKNNEMFEHCHKHLASKGAILLFPEGNSKTELRLRPIKTGAARIALGAEEAGAFELGVQIVPVGVNYSDPHTFRSDLFLNFGDPIDMREYTEAYKADPRAAVKELTERLKGVLEANTLVIENEQLDALIENIETIYKAQLRATIVDEAARDEFKISKDIIEAVEHFQKTAPERVQTVQRMIDDYLKNLDRFQLKDKQIKPERAAVNGLQVTLLLIFGLPLFLFGALNNIIPYKLTSVVSHKVVQRGDFFGSVQLLAGLLIFLLCYAGTIVTACFLLPWWAALAYAVMMPVAGMFALYYLKVSQRLRGMWMYLGLFVKKSNQVARLIKEREAIVAELEKGRAEFNVWRDAKGTAEA